ncbi:DUF4303 domain-containing protein [Paenibacillus radicis (ex Gao et al. 2016)]|uniref:DUF4303 domain-containing protein n=1 Tax=Paenibacillus radicis (ex Gao et al. 2016) TaxID=1737354 RepID=A0A917H854_9BACL|nr:DUF4303 domain-containing protein [Paenibacillus radicis (ex Gao et al. 2016)]GGG69729.1 hypothetical protein GCM10010918_26190 [Paenibacillus radicis (ex Gao et al. 2016)]
MKPTPELEALAAEIAGAARTSFRTLFENGERYYYCTLFTTGEGHAPGISAWSWEALEREAARQEDESGTPESTIAELIKWSYADSPYCCFADEEFNDVKQLFLELPAITELEADDRNHEFEFRLKAMEMAMTMLDKEGLFALNQPRESVCVLVEVMPPDEINTEIALRLNQAESPAIQAWLAEAAE